MLKMIAKRVLTIALILVMLLGFAPAIEWQSADGEHRYVENPFLLEAQAASVTSGNGTWISGKLNYSFSVATSSDNTTDAAGSVSASGYTLTVKATSAKQYDTGGCDSTTVAAATTTTTVTVTNASSYPLKFNTLTTTGSASVAGVSQGDTIASGATFTITVTSPANGTNATEKTGTVTVEVVEQLPHEVEITFLPPANIMGAVPGSYSISDGSQQYNTGTITSTLRRPCRWDTTIISRSPIASSAISTVTITFWLITWTRWWRKGS